MMKTPDEVKKGLERCKNGAHCDSCLIAYHCQVEADALALIEQLEERNNRLEYTLMGVMHSVDKWLDVEPYDFEKDDGTEAATRAANTREIALKAIEQLKWKKDVAEAHAIAKAFVIDRLERELDAAMKDMKKMAYESTDGVVCDLCARKDGVCLDCNFEWRGVKEEKDGTQI